MPDFPIIDAHLHLWDPQRFRMSWLDGNTLLNKPYGLAAYQEHTQGIAIEAMVYLQVDVEPAYALLEARWVVQRAQEDPRIRGIVPWAPLEYGLSFDICINYRQLAGVIKLVQQCPATAFILDHSAKPAIQAHVLDPWREQMRALAAYPNVVCKLSGMVTEADTQHWTPEDLAPYVSHVLEVFGEDRIVFGGDWPVVLGASSYARWVETLDRLTDHLSGGAKRKLWTENARRFYRL